MTSTYMTFDFEIKDLTKEEAAWLQNAIISLDVHNGNRPESNTDPLTEVDLGEITIFPLASILEMFPIVLENDGETNIFGVWQSVGFKVHEGYGLYAVNIFDGGECGNVQPLTSLMASFVKHAYHKALGFEWATVTIPSNPGGHGGGAAVIAPDGDNNVIDTNNWMYKHLKK